MTARSLLPGPRPRRTAERPESCAGGLAGVRLRGGHADGRATGRTDHRPGTSAAGRTGGPGRGGPRATVPTARYASSSAVRTGRVRGAAGTVAGAVLGVLLTTLSASPAQAAGYRYWSFWEQQDGAWSYATQGPSVLRPPNGAVLGFRFSVSENSGDAAKPRGPADFDAICGGTEPEPGTKRIALSIDFGTAGDAPHGERPPDGRTACARVDEDATAAEALAASAEPLRYNSAALLCAIAGYPEKGCGEQVASDGGAQDDSADGSGAGSAQDEPTAEAGGGDGGSGTSVGVAAGIGVVGVLAGAAAWQARRRRR